MTRLIFFCFFLRLLQADPSVVLVHIGSRLPFYLPAAVEQIRLFNSNCPIYIIANQEAIDKRPEELNAQRVTFVSCESIPKTEQHKKFWQDSVLDKGSQKGFWTFTTERFFYLASLMKDRNLEDVFHLENDVMLYADLTQLLPIFKANYPNKIAATFDNDQRCIPGFLYIANFLPMDHLTAYIAKASAQKGVNDMVFLASFKNRYQKKWIDSLPILMPDYAKQNELVSPHGHQGANPEDYFHHADSFASIFDAAAIGQYLGGIDPQHGQNTVGFINESCVFNPSKFAYEWELDEKNRKVPFAVYNGKKWRINNLHVHSKNLVSFLSLEKE